MFTGIVEEMGTVARIAPTGKGYAVTFHADVVLEGTRLGDSIAVNGTCLTVTRLEGKTFCVDIAPESRARTNLAQLKVGSRVNLERAVTPTTRLGGHMVQGHVDGTGTVTEMRTDGEALWVTVAAEPDILRYVVPKGFICLDGVSLTVVDTWAGHFNVMLIPHTRDHIILPHKTVGYAVNIEVDIVGKYVEKFVAGPLAARAGITADTLRDNGFA